MAVKGGGKLSHEDKIALLLKKAETTTPEEAEALTAKAVELMQKYGITQALLNSRRTGEKERIEVVKIPIKGIYASGYMDMMYSIARAYGGVEAYYTKYKQSDILLTIVGYESTVGQLKTLLASLQLQAVVALDGWWKQHQLLVAATPMEKFKARREFLKSFGYGAASRIRTARQSAETAAESETPGTALVLVDREQAVKDFLKQHAPKLKSSRNREQRGGYGASNAGYQAGKNANTGDKQVRNRRALT